MRGVVLLVLVLAGLTATARADGLLLSLSSREITIASNYQGAEVTLFGAALDKAGRVLPPGDYDIVAVARGPAETVAVREKARTAGLWVNRENRRFRDAPSYLFVLSNRPLAEIADVAARTRDDLGLDVSAARRLRGAKSPPDARDMAFVSALTRLQEKRGLWGETPGGIAFIGPSLFQGAFRLPAKVPLGRFEVEARLMRKGETLARETITFHVVKAGFEARLAELADTQRLAYGSVTVALALLLGWLASVIFRRD